MVKNTKIAHLKLFAAIAEYINAAAK